MTIKMLCADDSNIIQKSIRIAFDHYQVEVIEAASYPAVKELAAKNKFDIILVDSCLTGIDQAKDLEDFRKQNNQAHVIILKGSYDPSKTESWKESGFAHILEKPFSIQSVHNAVTESGLLLTLRPDKQKAPKNIPFEYYNYSTTPSQKAKEAQKPSANKEVISTEILSEVTRKVLSKMDYQTIEKNMGSEIKKIVEKKTEEIVQKYCADNFIPLAKKIIQEEIKTLASKK